MLKWGSLELRRFIFGDIKNSTGWDPGQPDLPVMWSPGLQAHGDSLQHQLLCDCHTVITWTAWRAQRGRQEPHCKIVMFWDILWVKRNKLDAHTGPEIARSLSKNCFVVGKHSDLEEMECPSQLGSLWQGLSSANAAVCFWFSRWESHPSCCRVKFKQFGAVTWYQFLCPVKVTLMPFAKRRLKMPFVAEPSVGCALH